MCEVLPGSFFKNFSSEEHGFLAETPGLLSATPSSTFTLGPDAFSGVSKQIAFASCKNLLGEAMVA